MNEPGMKPLLPDMDSLYEAGVRHLLDASVLFHIGRCGTVGGHAPEIARVTKTNHHKVTAALDRLQALKLVVITARANGRGRRRTFLVTGRGWKLLTQPQDFRFFHNAAPIPLEKFTTPQIP
jgi:DNA-binding MarR family transcriptional regulator